ncbi:hypothetical protein [Comamonas odontotermitis]|uniref:hypothetical protein n=1 Tax=Comamonas odontotermitis TaxID=379895 RepID=UPI001CC4DFBA|nr:hypothetical protein [Comamonas odontotermitis]UBB15398.1 hypothetical protein LAD35_10985 [Comamonas odontotermitis]
MTNQQFFIWNRRSDIVRQLSKQKQSLQPNQRIAPKPMTPAEIQCLYKRLGPDVPY